MKDIDYIFGMNYIEQFRRALLDYEPDEENVLGAIAHANIGRYPKGMFGELRCWEATREGRRVWTARCEAWKSFKALSEL